MTVVDANTAPYARYILAYVKERHDALAAKMFYVVL